MVHGLSTLGSFSLNPVADVRDMLSYDFMQYAFTAGTAMSLLGGFVGYFVVLRRAAFAGEALSHVAFTSVVGATVAGFNPLAGLFIITAGVALGMGLLGGRTPTSDVTTGIVLAWVLGLGALFLSIYTAASSGGNAQVGVNALFGSILGLSNQQAQGAVVVGAAAGIVLIGIGRPLLFASIDSDVAAARRLPVVLLGALFLVVVAVTVAEGVQVVGALLILALLVTPAAIAQRLTVRPFHAMILSAALALSFTWLGLILGFYEPYPVSFFITALAFGGYVLAVAGQNIAQRVARLRPARR